MRTVKSLAFVAILLAIAGTGWTQTHLPLRNRVSKPDPAKYRQVRDAKDWKNPYLIVRRDGIEILGVTSIEPAVPVELIGAELERMPRSAWPYGLVVAVQDVGIGSSGDGPRIEANRAKLLALLKRLETSLRRTTYSSPLLPRRSRQTTSVAGIER